MTELGAPTAGVRRRTRRSLLPRLALAAAGGIVGGVLVQVLQRTHTPAPALPGLHGQAVWAAGVRPAPNFALRDQHGALVSLRSLRGRTVLLTFLDSQCHSSCPIVGRQLGSLLRRLPASARPALVVVSVDPTGDTRAGIAHALTEWGLAGPWPVHWVNAPQHVRLRRVWKQYGIVVQPKTHDILHSLALYLIDRRGDERTAYLFPFLPAFVQRDLTRLAAGRA